MEGGSWGVEKVFRGVVVVVVAAAVVIRGNDVRGSVCATGAGAKASAEGGAVRGMRVVVIMRDRRWWRDGSGAIR